MPAIEQTLLRTESEQSMSWWQRVPNSVAICARADPTTIKVTRTCVRRQKRKQEVELLLLFYRGLFKPDFLHHFPLYIIYINLVYISICTYAY